MRGSHFSFLQHTLTSAAFLISSPEVPGGFQSGGGFKYESERAVVLVGARPDSAKYVSMKKKAAKELGFHSVDHTLDEDTPQAEVERVVAELKFALPKMYKHHKKASLDVAVDFWRLAV